VTVRVRAIDAGELDELLRVTFTAFGEEASEGELAHERSWAEVDRMLGAEVDGRFVGCAGAYSFPLVVPGGADVPVAGVSFVGVLPTHRRQGVLTAMMRTQLDDVVARGEPVATLTASEAPIYGRFGYGSATRLAKVAIDTAGGLAMAAPVEAGGRLRMVDGGDAQIAACQPVFERVRRRRVGEVGRPDAWWTAMAVDREKARHGASPRYCVVHEATDGRVDGYARYRVKPDWDENRPRGEVRLEDLAAEAPEAEAALLGFLADVDLTTRVTTWSRPVDDWWPHRLADHRRYRVTLVHEHLWVRVLDVPGALAARSWAGPGEVVLGVDDPFRPATSGRYRLAVDAEGAAEVERVGSLHDGDADAFAGIDALGMLYLGDVTPTALARAGRLLPRSAHALATLDRLFATTEAPYTTLAF
jgi:predicted acetyltransferase